MEPEANSYNKIANIIIDYFKKNNNDFNLKYDDYKNYIKFPADLKIGINHLLSLVMKI